MTKAKSASKQMSEQISGFAIASLILGVVSLIPAIGIILGLAALILGIIAIQNINKNNIVSKRMAIAGIVLGVLGMLSTIVIYGSLFYFGFISKSGPFAEVRSKVSQQIITQNAGYLELYKKEYGKYPKSLEELNKEEYAVFPIDHFMQPLHYKVAADGQTYELKSIGPDGKLGTTDDIFLP